MDVFNAPADIDLRHLDPYGGVLVSTTYWRPRPGDPHPEQPGEKVSILSYLPTAPQALCPCGSGKPFSACCQPLPYWRMSSCEMMSGSIALRIRRSEHSGSIGEIQPLILPPTEPCASGISSCQRTTRC